MGWNYLSIPKLQRCNRWSLGMDKQFHRTLYNGCNYLCMSGVKLNHVGKRDPRTSTTARLREIVRTGENPRRYSFALTFIILFQFKTFIVGVELKCWQYSVHHLHIQNVIVERKRGVNHDYSRPTLFRISPNMLVYRVTALHWTLVAGQTRALHAIIANVTQ